MIEDNVVLSFYFYLFAGLALIALELLTTTFYLLLIGIACLIASLSALILHDWLIPTLSAGILSLVSCYLLSKHKGKKVLGK
jgi:Membrane protein implicated in regulation of membrane protease activity